ncbi:hypothetical protein [Microcoleus sp. herbarium5]|uniref:hypothetical protein n=1 Tax=Microcoleus sp. herbarium5 TaxID=3055434 RepID=UPI002FD72A75
MKLKQEVEMQAKLLKLPFVEKKVEMQVQSKILVPTSIRLANTDASKKQRCCT